MMEIGNRIKLQAMECTFIIMVLGIRAIGSTTISMDMGLKLG